MSAGLELIFERGYEAVSLRELAAAVGIQPGSLYNHIQSKQDLLVTLIVRHLTALLEAVDEALADAESPACALRAFIHFHLTYHLPRRREIHIANSEARSLLPENRRVAVELRREYEQRLAKILYDLAGASKVDPANIRVATYGIIAMLTGAVNWYRSDGSIGPDQLVQMHTELIFNGLSAWGVEPGADLAGAQAQGRLKPLEVA